MTQMPATQIPLLSTQSALDAPAAEVAQAFGFACRCAGSWAWQELAAYPARPGASVPEDAGDVDDPGDGAGAVLVYDEKGLSLCSPAAPHERMRVDFLAGRTGYRLGTHANTSQPVLKAVGFREPPYTVIDATAGLGADGLLLACAGCRVILCERSPVMAALLSDGLRRAREDEELARLLDERVELVFADARQVLRDRGADADAAYLDPMFPPRQKSALVKKEMRLAKLAAGTDPDAAEVLAVALECVPRVAVKRPLKAEALGPGVRRKIEGRSVRFDLYGRC